MLYKWRRSASGTLLLLTIILYLVLREQDTIAVPLFTGLENPHTEPLFPPLPDGCPVENPGTSSLDKTIACTNFPVDLLSTVQVVIKTGAGEEEKTKKLLDTVASCISNPLIVSDTEDVFGGHQVFDILTELSPSYAINNPDWAAYIELQENIANKTPIEKSHERWKLDRFKFLPMVELAFELAPEAQWYVFIEADIYIFWDTLFRLLGTMDPEKYHYVGSPSPGSKGVWFVYGGGGIVVSGKLVRDLLKGGQQKVSAKYEQMVKDDTCGDAVLAYVIYRELGYRMEALYPTFSGEDPIWLRVGKARWCIPLLGLHHVSTEMMADLWRWERCRPPTSQPITYATYLDFFLTARVEEGPIPNWDNRPDYRLPDNATAHESAHACELACTANGTCLQYRYSKDDHCRISDWVWMGEAVEDQSKEFVSGWSFPRLKEMGFTPGENPGQFCSRPDWTTQVGDTELHRRSGKLS